jgi:hypothetical protein
MLIIVFIINCVLASQCHTLSIVLKNSSVLNNSHTLPLPTTTTTTTTTAKLEANDSIIVNIFSNIELNKFIKSIINTFDENGKTCFDLILKVITN